MSFYTTKEETEQWLNLMGIKNYIIHDDLKVDVKENVNISAKNLDFIPIQFGLVHGDFNCSQNNLKSLEGSPYEVACFEPYGRDTYHLGSFFCQDNQLESLAFAPKKVFRYMHCVDNAQLKDFPSFDTQVQTIVLNDNNGELIKKTKQLRPYLAKNSLGFYQLKFDLIKEYLEKKHLDNQIDEVENRHNRVKM